MSEAIWRLCDQCDRVMDHDQAQSCGPNDPPARFLKNPKAICFMHTACVRPERAERMMPLKDWLGSSIGDGEPWPWERTQPASDGGQWDEAALDASVAMDLADDGL